jgi:hypothetical protein
MRPISLMLATLLLPALSQPRVRLRYCKTGWPIRGRWPFSPTIRAC